MRATARSTAIPPSVSSGTRDHRRSSTPIARLASGRALSSSARRRLEPWRALTKEEGSSPSGRSATSARSKQPAVARGCAPPLSVWHYRRRMRQQLLHSVGHTTAESPLEPAVLRSHRPRPRPNPSPARSQPRPRAHPSAHRQWPKSRRLPAASPARPGQTNAFDLWWMGVVAVLRYFTGPPRPRPMNPTESPRLSNAGNMIRSRNRSMRWPSPVTTARPAATIA